MLLEALALAKPIIATDVGGSSDVVRDGVNGFLTELTAENISSAMQSPIINGSLRKRMGVEGKKHFEKRFSRKHVLSQVRTLYKTLRPWEVVERYISRPLPPVFEISPCPVKEKRRGRRKSFRRE